VEWPNDADGDVFRRLQESGFDFRKVRSVDYNVDFMNWPPAEEALKILRANYGQIALYEPDENGLGYVQFQVEGRLTYDAVMAVQKTATLLNERFGGACESWGVFE
jgi:hypothetical protein